MGSAIPKQYLSLNGRTVLEHTLTRIANHEDVNGVVVALAPNDVWWPTLTLPSSTPIFTTLGGTKRCHSVRNAIEILLTPKIGARENDWVLVHDAVRPCVRKTDISRLMTTLADHPTGGLLGIPVRDTMKHTSTNKEVLRTVVREGLWHALTPQMFRVGKLIKALTYCIDQSIIVTDEAQAIELQNEKKLDSHPPHMVEGSGDNIKITRHNDLALAEFFLLNQKET